VAILDWILLAVLGVPYAWLWALLAFAFTLGSAALFVMPFLH